MIFLPDWESQKIMSSNCQIWSRSQWSHLEIWLVKDVAPLNEGYSLDPLQLIERSLLIFLPDWASQKIMASNCQIWTQSQWSQLDLISSGDLLVKGDHKRPTVEPLRWAHGGVGRSIWRS